MWGRLYASLTVWTLNFLRSIQNLRLQSFFHTRMTVLAHRCLHCHQLQTPQNPPLPFQFKEWPWNPAWVPLYLQLLPWLQWFWPKWKWLKEDKLLKVTPTLWDPGYRQVKAATETTDLENASKGKLNNSIISLIVPLDVGKAFDLRGLKCTQLNSLSQCDIALPPGLNQNIVCQLWPCKPFY